MGQGGDAVVLDPLDFVTLGSEAARSGYSGLKVVGAPMHDRRHAPYGGCVARWWRL